MFKQNHRHVFSDSSSFPPQVAVMIYPEPGLTDQYYIPWWIILIAILAGILLLTLLVCILWKVTTSDCFAFWYRKLKKKKKKIPCFLQGKIKTQSSSQDTLISPRPPETIIPFCDLFSIIFVLFCPVMTLLFLAHALLIYLYPPPSLFCLLSFPTGNHYSDCFSSCTFSIPPCSDLLPQCGFFKRSERRPHYETEYYQAQLGVQPSEAEKQASEL